MLIKKQSCMLAIQGDSKSNNLELVQILNHGGDQAYNLVQVIASVKTTEISSKCRQITKAMVKITMILNKDGMNKTIPTLKRHLFCPYVA